MGKREGWTASTLATEYPVPLPLTCDAGLWTTMTPVLSLDGAGTAFLAYDAEYDTRCWYQDPNGSDPPEYRFSSFGERSGVSFAHSKERLKNAHPCP